MMATARNDRPGLKKKKPFPREVERANVLSIDNDEIGLLDILFLDAIVKSETRKQ